MDHRTYLPRQYIALSVRRKIWPLDTTGLALDGECLSAAMAGADGVAFSESYTVKMLRKGSWKLIYYVNSPHHELYDLSADPHEYNNLAESHRHLGHLDKAVEMHQAVVKIAARIESMRHLMKGHQGLCEDWLAKGEPARAFRAAERAMEYSLPLVSGLAQAQAADARKQLTNLHDAAIRRRTLGGLQHAPIRTGCCTPATAATGPSALASSPP